MDRSEKIETMTRGSHDFDAVAVNLTTPDIMEKHAFIPVAFRDGKLFAAFADPFDVGAREALRAACTYEIVPMFASRADIDFYIDKFFGASFIKKINPSDGASIINLLDGIIKTAVLRGASDIHIEPCEKHIRLRLRVDGILAEFDRLPSEILPNLISRLKIISGMDISERRLPQDGHFKQTRGETKIDFRVSTISTIYGEKAVIRIIYEEIGVFDKHGLGFFDDGIDMLNGLLKNKNGVILLTGPTGSGKTTTLAALVKDINDSGINIITVEDPVENVIHGVNQININPKTGFDFANALRSIVRQDPDVIMVGEIRDEETALLAVRSAITGHLVLSTLHTNDAASAIFRLIDMNVPDYLVYTALKGIVSQRLVRRICPRCKRKLKIARDDAFLLDLPVDSLIYSGDGCINCNNTGYSGRFAVYEILAADDEFKQFLWERPSARDIDGFIKKSGMKTMRECAIQNVLLGNTTVREIIRAVVY